MTLRTCQRDLEGPMPEQVKKRLEEEIKQLEYELTTELPAEIKKAVALGDLSENAEYHMAKQRQVFVNARLGQLKKRMGELAMVNLVNIPHDKVGFGATVTVFDSSKDEEIQYKLVTSEESDVTQGADLDDLADRPLRCWAKRSATWPPWLRRTASASLRF